MTSLVDVERAGGVVYFGFTKGFDTISHSILTDKLMKDKLNKWAGGGGTGRTTGLKGAHRSLVEYAWG